MDLQAAIVYNGHTSVPATPPLGGGAASGCVMRSINPSPVTVDVRSDKLALTDGMVLSDAYLGGRTLNLHAEIFAASLGELWRRVGEWMKAYSPRSPSFLVSAPLYFSTPTDDTGNWPSGLIPMFLTCAPTRQPWHGEISRLDSASGAHVMDVYATLFAADPFEYINADRQFISLTTNYQALTYRGNAPATANVELWLQVSATGPHITVTIQSALSRPDLGYSNILLDLSGLTPGLTYSLSMRDKIVSLGGVTALPGVISSASVFGSITPGATIKYTVTSGSGGNLTTCILYYPEACF
jgi:hypothetical protein